jgi:Phospholipid-translocating ATPase N-terminal
VQLVPAQAHGAVRMYRHVTPQLFLDCTGLVAPWHILRINPRRYNPVTFVPRFLFEQFSQIAYFYFLVQVLS